MFLPAGCHFGRCGIVRRVNASEVRDREEKPELRRRPRCVEARLSPWVTAARWSRPVAPAPPTGRRRGRADEPD